MLCYRTLENCDLLTVYEAFKAAFSDYIVPMKPAFSQFENILLRRGYNAVLSIGAFENDQLVGFILSSSRMWHGKKTLYTIGVGVIPVKRGQKIAEKLYHELFNLGRNAGIEQYLLEVITTNTPAIKLYEKLGFKQARRLRCFELKKTLPAISLEALSLMDSSVTFNTKYQIAIETEVLSHTFEADLQQFMDYSASWQYSFASIQADAKGFYYVVAKVDHAIAGIIIADQETGAIYQIAIAQDHRQQQLATAMLTVLKAKMPEKNFSLSNIDDRNHSLLKFIEALEFEHLIDQYEMLKVV